MSRHVAKILIILFSSAIFTILFYRVRLGLNLVIFETIMVVLSFLLFRKKLTPRYKWGLFYLLLLISVFSVLFIHTAFAVTINIFLFLQVMALHLWPEAAKTHLLSLITPLNIFPALSKGIQAILNIRKPGIFRKWPGLSLTIASIFVIWLFTSLYAASNNYFSKLVNKTTSIISDFFSTLFNFDNADILLYALMGILVTTALLIRTDIAEKIHVSDNPGSFLLRRKSNSLFKKSYGAFFKWYRTGIFLMTILNVLILIFNYLDLILVWFSFEWDGQLLREFVHEGTWTLVFCVSLSALLAILFFNGNIHFYSGNKFLKWLVNIWIVQNIFMIASVFVRNIRYVDYYNLAALRIGVFIFLIIAAFALIALLLKINRGRNMFWLIKSVFIFSAVVLTITSAINWNRVIAHYNINHRNSGYFHHDYMVMLPGQTLDIIVANRNLFDEKYRNDEYHQYSNFFTYNDTIETYNDIVEKRVEQFNKQMSETDWREWNFADWRAYNRLKEY